MTLSFQRYRTFLVLSVLLTGSSLPLARSDDILPQSELNPLPTFEPVHLPNPLDVPGKEYSNDSDKNASGDLDPGQVVRWKGDGTTVWDSINYCVAGRGGGVGGLPFQVDALANIRGKYFFDLDGTRTPVVNPEDNKPYQDTVSLVVSLHKQAGYEDNGYQNNIYASRSSFRKGGAELWANWQTNINGKSGALDDLDGLELYGPDGADDSNMYSRQGDPDTDGLGRVSAFRFHPNQLDPHTGLSVPYLRTRVLLSAVIDDDGHHPDWVNSYNPNDFDLDAMKIWDVDNDDQFGPGDEILFSVRPIEGLFDGGEIWLYKYDDASAEFLTQGLKDDGITPRVWNTANKVSQFFFKDELHGENIDALEALAPEPSSFILLFVGGLTSAALVLRRRRR
jgi:hypothetical protein